MSPPECSDQGHGRALCLSSHGRVGSGENPLELVRRGGGICEVGFFVDGGEYSINPHEDICKKEIMLVGSWAYNRWEYPNAYHFLQRAARIGIPVEKLITHRFPLDRIEDSFEANIGQEGIKIIVENPHFNPVCR